MCLAVILESIKPVYLFKLQKISIYGKMFVLNCFLSGPENLLIFQVSEMRKLYFYFDYLEATTRGVL